MINDEISMPTLYRRFHVADDQQRGIESFVIETVSLRWWSTARYRCLLYRRFHFADHQRRDIESFIIETASLRRSSTARYRCLLYADGFTSPMINGEILRPSLYRRFHLADDQRRDIESFIIQTVSLGRWSTARYRCLLYTAVSLRRWPTARYCVLHYTDGFTWPMINDEILSPSLYRRFHFADDQRRDIASFFIQTVSLRRWSTARFPICIILRIFNQTDCDIHMKKAVLYIETIT